MPRETCALGLDPPVPATRRQPSVLRRWASSEERASAGLLAGAGNPFFYSTRTFENSDEANLDVQIAAFHRAQTVDKLSEALIIESINKIQARRMEDWPSF